MDEKPYTMPLNATAEISTEATSKGAERVSELRRIRARPKVSMTTASGRTLQNIHRQSSEARTRPPIIGPTAEQPR